MTDKEKIIIDGVDVSKCERHCSDNYSTPNMCYSDITCGYRHCNPKENQCNFYITSIEEQLARKTQECEQLKEQLQANQPTGICETCMAKVILQNDKYRKTLEELKEENEELNEKFERREKAFNEIKSIVSSTLDCGEWIGQGDNKMENILDIINKAKDTTNE